MILQQTSEQTAQPVDDQSPVPTQEDQTVKVPIEVKWNIPAWMLTKPVEPHMQESPEELD